MTCGLKTKNWRIKKNQLRNNKYPYLFDMLLLKGNKEEVKKGKGPKRLSPNKTIN